MSFSPVNLSIAKPEESFQQLAYINAVAKHAVVYYAVGNAHQLSISLWKMIEALVQMQIH